MEQNVSIKINSSHFPFQNLGDIYDDSIICGKILSTFFWNKSRHVIENRLTVNGINRLSTSAVIKIKMHFQLLPVNKLHLKGSKS
jgi:hypothetical protein